jgi:HPr kinase/phosphorylase
MVTPTIHASAVLVGTKAVLIRGPSGSGKSRLALALLQAADDGVLPFARLVADDRCHAEAVNGRVLLRPAKGLEGLIEVRGLGIRRVPYEAQAIALLAVDLAEHQPRMPDAGDHGVDVAGIRLPRLAVGAGNEPFPLLLAALKTTLPSGI